MDCSKESELNLDTFVLKRESYTRFERSHKPQQNKVYTGKHNISQEIHVQKQKFQCIINLKTTVYNHKSKHRQKHEKSKCLRSKNEELIPKLSPNHNVKQRIIPKCFRKSCEVNLTRSYNRHKGINGSVEHHHYQRGDNGRKYMDQRKSRYSHRDNNLHNSWPEKRKIDLKLLSPISSSPLNSLSDLTYEDISTTSLKSYDNKATSYKRKHCKHRKHHRHCSHYKKREHVKHKEDVQESKLDTLIKRTKERERKLLEESRRFNMPWCSTPLHKEMNHDEYDVNSSDMDISFVSRSTLVLDTRGHFPYSPSNFLEDYQESEIEKHYLAYSFSPSNANEDFLTNFPESGYVKSEPMVDIEIYSPTHSPDNFAHNLQFTIEGCSEKGVLKTEPQ